MIKNYFKTFLKIAAQNKLFTFLSLFGISITIMFVMIISMCITKITSGSGPEKNLKRIILSDRVKTVNTSQSQSGGQSVGGLGKTLCEENLKKVKSAEVSSMFTGAQSWEFILKGKYQLKYRNLTDAEYWKIFDYKFLQGRPYTGEEVINKANLAVVTRSLKELLFGNEAEILGKTVRYGNMDLVVIGVVDDPPVTSQNATGDLYLPYTLPQGDFDFDNYIGSYKIAYRSASKEQLKTIRNEVRDIINRIDAADTVNRIYLAGPFSQFENLMANYSDPEEYTRGSRIFRYLLQALAFILLPALNLMALNFARIHERGEEIAVRKSFGAAGSVLRYQFLFENIMMTLAGGAIGIILSYVVVALLGNSFFINLTFMNQVPLTFSFNIVVFVIALLSCLLFGLFSGYLPAIRLSGMKPAVYLKGGDL